MFPGGGGDNSVTVSINGSSVGLQDALRVASEQLQQTGRQFDVLGASAQSSGAVINDSQKLWIDSLKLAADQMDLTTQRMKILSDMADMMGASAAEGADAWLGASSSAADYGARLDYLAAQVRMVTEANEQMAATMGGGGGFSLLGGMGGGLMGMFGGFGDVIEGAVGKMASFVEQAGAMVAGLISFSVLNDVIQQVQGFTDSLITLNEQTEKNQYSWMFLYGGGNTPKGQAIAQQMADWTKGFSMQIPYTRQDLLNAVTNLAPMGLSAKGLEHFMPTIADLAATRDPNATLAQVAQVIMSAGMGYTRMLKYDLKINPADLIQYGLNATGTGTGIHINDPNTLLPALEAYAKANGLAGAAKDTAHQTFWGAWSSFIDRIQNFELDTGKPLFGGLKDQLNGLSSWIDTHGDQIQRFSDLIGNGLGGAFHTAADWVGQFMSGLGQAGLLDWLNPPAPKLTANAHTQQSLTYGATTPTHEGAPLAHNRNQVVHGTPPTEMAPPQNLSGWQQAGQVIGGFFKEIGDDWDRASKVFSPLVKQAVDDLGKSFDNFKNSFTPQEKETMKGILQALVAVPWLMLIGLIAGVAKALDFMALVGPKVLDFLKHGADLWGQNLTMLGNFLDTLGKMKDNLTTWANDIKTKALTWGEDLISNIITGIGNKLTDLKNAVGNVANIISGPLHQSKADYGPLADTDMWGVHLVENIIHGMESGASRLGAASDRLAATLAAGFRPAGGYAPVGGYGSANGGGHGTVIVINGSSTLEVLKIIDAALAHRDAHTNTITRSPGGVGLYAFGTLGGGR